MRVILLSGGSGKRLWPLSNDSRSKQFLRLLSAPDGGKESMIQRVVRQIKAARLTDDIVVATGVSQKDSIENQLGDKLSIVTEPCRRDTFPAILLACIFLASQNTPADEPVVVMPCDSYTEDGYFTVIGRMAEAVKLGVADLILMGIEPTYPSAKFGYIVPTDTSDAHGAMPVRRFTEKPDVATAEKLIVEGALWNGGVFAFRLGYIMKIAEEMKLLMDFKALHKDYADLPKISFDYAVVEKAESVAVMPYSGEWKDLGTWNTLTEELSATKFGDVTTDGTDVNTHIFNELSIPLICLGTHDLVIAASHDGILVAEKSKSESIKDLASGVKMRPMFEERSWGSFTIIDKENFPDGHSSFTRRVEVKSGSELEIDDYPDHDKVLTVLQGDGEVTINGVSRTIRRGDVITIPYDNPCILKALTQLTFIEVSSTHSNCANQ